MVNRPADQPAPARPVHLVVGSVSAAQAHDLPAARRVLHDLAAALRARAAPAAPQIVTDFHRLADDALAHLPCICIGHPEVNALSAFLADKLPPALVIDGALAVQFNIADREPVALLWGVDHAATNRAADLFTQRFLDAFADAVAHECR
ncbi:MAG: hypothetical protein KF699_05870 [Phycisphaeraceae bacterium]|nr:hypothetical protein [Phycisphaeraceae bacterium]